MNSDPIADFLTRIRNASMVNKPSVSVPHSKFKLELSKLLKEELKNGGGEVPKGPLRYFLGVSGQLPTIIWGSPGHLHALKKRGGTPPY